MGPRAFLERRVSPAPRRPYPGSGGDRIVGIEHVSGAGRAPGFSLLRLSVPVRLVLVAIVTALLWLFVLWALT